MQFIQCPKCDKKYGVNDKVKAAAGKNINCKACGTSFEIIILEQSKKSKQPPKQAQESLEQQSKITSSKPADQLNGTNNQFEKDMASNTPPSQRKRRKRPAANAQLQAKAPKKLSPTSILGVLILAISVYVFYLDRGDKFGQPFVKTTPTQPTIEQKKNMHVVTLEKDEQADLAAQAESHNAVKIPPHENLSKACKEVCAKQWMIDYTMIHGTPKGSEYIRLMDQSVNNTAEIRKECGDPYFVHEVISTATAGTPPGWLVDAVNELTGWDESAPRF